MRQLAKEKNQRELKEKQARQRQLNLEAAKRGDAANSEYGLGYPKPQYLPGKVKTFTNLPMDVCYPENLLLDDVKVQKVIRTVRNKRGQITKTLVLGSGKEDEPLKSAKTTALNATGMSESNDRPPSARSGFTQGTITKTQFTGG